MWLTSVEVMPKPKENPEAAQENRGAYANGRINFKLEEASVELAKGYIKQSSWTFLE